VPAMGLNRFALKMLLNSFYQNLLLTGSLLRNGAAGAGIRMPNISWIAAMKSLKAKSRAASPNVQRYFFRLFVPIRIQVRDITSKYSKFAIVGKISRSGIIEIALHITFPGLLSLWRRYMGKAIAARIAMMTMTISSSTIVKPPRFLCICFKKACILFPPGGTHTIELLH